MGARDDWGVMTGVTALLTMSTTKEIGEKEPSFGEGGNLLSSMCNMLYVDIFLTESPSNRHM